MESITTLSNETHCENVLREIKKNLLDGEIVEGTGPDFTIFGQRVSFRIKNELTNFGWRSKPTGKKRLSFTEPGGRYGTTNTNLPQKKDGTFSYDRVANGLISYARYCEKLARNRDNRQSHQEGVNAFKKEHGLSYGSPFYISPSTNEILPCVVEVKFTRTVSYADAEKLLTGLRSLGILN